MLLNVGPAADGTIPEQAQEILLGIGDWLRVNGEAIYKTRPWQIFGEGPTRNTGGGFSERKDKPYTSKDVRFTSSKDGKTIYAIVLGWPEVGRTVTIESLANDKGPQKILSIKLLGYKGRPRWRRHRQGLKIQMPLKKPCEHAFALKIAIAE
jgi:alpha-L-fucosidase